MKKLTAKKCGQRIWELKVLLEKDQLSMTGEIALQAMEIALPILEQQEGAEFVRVAFTGSGSLESIKHGGEGFIWGSKEEAHPIELFARSKYLMCER